MREDSEKITEACVESGMGLAGIEKWEEPHEITVREYNLLPAKYRLTHKGFRMVFIVGLGWRRCILVK